MRTKSKGQLLCAWLGKDPGCCLSLLPAEEQGRAIVLHLQGWERDGVQEVNPEQKVKDNKHASQRKGQQRSGLWQTEKLNCGFQCARAWL